MRFLRPAALLLFVNLAFAPGLPCAADAPPAFPNEGYLGVTPGSELHCTIELPLGGMGGVLLTPEQKTTLEKYLKNDIAVKSVSTFSWGKEGEYSYCILLAQSDQTCGVAERIKRIVPGISLVGHKRAPLDCP